MSREPALQCYACKRPALPGDQICPACGFTLDWGAIGDLRSLDYLKLRLDQWHRRGDLDDELVARLADEVEGNRATLLRVLAEGGAGARPRPRQAAPEPRPAEPPPFVPPARRPVPAGLRPRYTIGPAVAERPAARAAGAGQPPPFTRPPRFAPPAPPKPPRRPLLDVLVDFGTVRLMLYTGALLFAVGIVVWLRDALRVQLQRPVVQASLLGLVTFAVLAGGVALVVRARERAEQRLIGRGILFLGTLLLPLNPWFWLRTGLIEDRGNAWVVTLVTFALSLAIALGLGDRVFVYMSYAAALATGWLLTFKMTGGASPGAYALVLSLVSGAYLHAELPADRAAERRGWEKLGQALFLCGHIGIALTLIFYTGVARFIPAELYAAFRHFDTTGYTPWIGVAVALLAAQAYLYSAWRRDDPRFTYVGAGAALWSLALSLLAWDVPAGVWLAACGAVALVSLVAGRALEREPLWGPPLGVVSRVFAWLGFVAAAGVAIAMTNGVEIRWFTALGAALLLATFAIEAAATRRFLEAVPLAPLVLLLAAYALRVAGAPWVYADAVLAALLAVAPFATAMLPNAEGEHAETRAGIQYSVVALCGLLAIAALDFAVDASPGVAHLPVPFAVALAVAFATNGWVATAKGMRFVLYALSGLFVETAVLLGVAVVEYRLRVDDRYAVFLLAPLAYAFLGAWLALRRAAGERFVEVGHVARAWAAVAVAVAAARAFPLLMDATLDWRGAYALAGALALLAAVPLAAAAVERDTSMAYAEGTYGVLLAIGAWTGLVAAVAQTVPDGYRGLAAFVVAGLAPLALAGAEWLVTDSAPAVAVPAGVTAGALAVLLLLGLSPVLFVDLRAETTPTQAAFVSLALLLAAYGLSSAARYAQPWRALWTAHATVAVAAGAHAVLGSVPDAAAAALGVAVAGALALVAGTRAARAAAPLAPAGISIGHALVGVALVDALATQAGGQPVSWVFVAVVAIAAAGYAMAAAAADRNSTLDRAHRALAFIATVATAVAALHAAGLTTVAAQAEPLAFGLAVAMAAFVFAPSEWSRREGTVLAHAMTAMLVVLVVATSLTPAAGWTAPKVARFALYVAAFYGVGSVRRVPASLACSIAAACVSVLAVCHELDAAWPTRAVVFSVVAVALLVASARLPEGLGWARATVERSGHIVFLLSLVGELAFVAPELALGNPSLSRHAAAFGTLTAVAWVARRALGDSAAAYGVAWRALAFATYGLVGVRLGYHPWRDSAYYTLPVGVVLVGLGAWASRREDSREAGLLLWLGSVVAAAPMLLHALDNRFIQRVASDHYDMATLSVGLALAISGLLFQLRAPSGVGAATLGVDLFVIAFSQIRWNQLTLAIFATLLGALMIAVSWFILYRRDDLYRMRDFLGAKVEAFRQWK